ncbi:MAG: hypothetical protein HOJ35_00190, partial [Bdellovibrionales bacterium]|nr:hypothetical protein [Bdellovibrionales bacterium]
EQVFRKRGHFYSLLDEFNRCRGGIQQEKDTGKKVFEDSEFINPHFLGVDSQACIGKKRNDGLCDNKDPRNTNGVDNCSLGYRKYLLKMIAITNQGQKFGQLFNPKSIAYDSVDKKYYVVDCYHHCIQCFVMKEGEKVVTESGDKLKFVSADEKYNDKALFYYDENFSTETRGENGGALKYNKSDVHALGLRQNMIFEEDFSKFSRLGEISDDVPEAVKNKLIMAQKYNQMKINIDDMKNILDSNELDIFLLKSTDDETESAKIKKKILLNLRSVLKLGKDNSNIFDILTADIIDNNEREKFTRNTNRYVNKAKSIMRDSALGFEDELSKLREKRVKEAEIVEEDVPFGDEFIISIPDSDRTYDPRGFPPDQQRWESSTLNSASGYFPSGGVGSSGSILLESSDEYFISGLEIKGRGDGAANQYVKKINVYVGTNKRILIKAGSNLPANTDTSTVKHVTLPKPVKGKYIKIQSVEWVGNSTMRVDILGRQSKKEKKMYYRNQLIDEDGYLLDDNGNIINEEDDDVIETFQSSGATAPESKENKKFSKEKGYSIISDNWAEKYSDTKINLSRWVSGISEWGNHIYADFKKNIDYKKINSVGDFYFNTEKGGAGESPGCGEFSYPSDIAISSNSCLGQNIQVLMVTDTGNNRVSVFKKYNLQGNMRFRFYCFLGDEEEEEE